MVTFWILALISFTVSYLFGSIPTAFLLVKWFSGKNILEYGTGNVGTMNTHRATGKKWLTLLVLAGDLSKGLIVWRLIVWMAGSWAPSSLGQLFNPAALFPWGELSQYSLLFSIAFAGLILGHNYSVWLKFKGGKGLAAAAGFLLGYSPILVILWILSFLIVTAVSKYMVLGQTIASLVLPLAAILAGNAELFWVLLPGCALVFIKHAPRLALVASGQEPKLYYKERS
jgi:acyl phosphate:glycerol-3-phosphate acyltransferase